MTKPDIQNLTFRKLTTDDLDSIIFLQQEIIEHLGPGENEFITHRNREDFEKLLTPPSGLYGCFDGDKLIAQMAYDLPTERHAGTYPEFKPLLPAEKLIVFEAILVDPAYRGHGLMRRMMAHTEKVLQDKTPERVCSIMKIAYNNPASWISAMNHGMTITKIGIDPDDGGKVFYLGKTAHPPQTTRIGPSKSVKLKNILIHGVACYQYMEYLMAHGYIGTVFDKTNKELIFVQPQNCLSTSKAPFPFSHTR